MSKRIFAWVLLAGFVALLLNILVFHVYMVQSISVYLIIAIWFIFSNKTLHKQKVNNQPPEKIAENDEQPKK